MFGDIVAIEPKPGAARIPTPSPDPARTNSRLSGFQSPWGARQNSEMMNSSGGCALFPEVLESAIEDGTTQSEDGVGAAHGPVHAVLLEALSDDVAASGLDDA